MTILNLIKLLCRQIFIPTNLFFYRNASTLTPNHSKSLSTPHTAQNIMVHPVMKSNSNPAVDKQAMGINSGNYIDLMAFHYSLYIVYLIVYST